MVMKSSTAGYMRARPSFFNNTVANYMVGWLRVKSLEVEEESDKKRVFPLAHTFKSRPTGGIYDVCLVWNQ